MMFDKIKEIIVEQLGVNPEKMYKIETRLL